MKLLATAVVAAAALATAATAATPTLTLAASAPAVLYGKPVTLTGTLSTLQANQVVTIKGVACGTTKSTNAARTKTTANGAYTATATPVVTTTYQAFQKSVQSNTVAVAVKPVVALKRLARGSFQGSVTAGLDFKGKSLLFQRYATLRKRWVQVKKVTLTTSVPGTKPTIVSSAKFKAKAPKRARVRLVLTKAQAAPCYAAANSNTVRN
jgi:hypothetical protein